MLALELIKILVLSSRATSNGIYSSLFATHNEKLLDWSEPFFKGKVTEVDVTQTYCDQNTTKTSIVHTINNWHASCTRNFKNPLASTYSSFDIIPEQATNHNTELVPIKFWSRKANNKRLLFTIRIAQLKAETQQHPTFGQYVFNNTKALTKVTKDHQKKPKSLTTTIIFNKIDSYNQWRALIQ